MYLFIFMVSVFVLYVAWVWIRYGIQSSISDSYYRYYKNGKEKYLFTFFIWGFAYPALMLTATPLMFFAVMLLGITGASPAFKSEKAVKWSHMLGAYGGVLLSQASIVYDFKMWYITLIFIILSGTLMILNVNNKIWWVECVAFLSICLVIGLNL